MLTDEGHQSQNGLPQMSRMHTETNRATKGLGMCVISAVPDALKTDCPANALHFQNNSLQLITENDTI